MHVQEVRMFRHILVPVDGSELTDRSIEASIALAKQLGAAITGFVAEPFDATCAHDDRARSA
jgi:nucleotide-binding universal stress UspA family protein